MPHLLQMCCKEANKYIKARNPWRQVHSFTLQRASASLLSRRGPQGAQCDTWNHGNTHACQRALAYGWLGARHHRKRPCTCYAKARWGVFIRGGAKDRSPPTFLHCAQRTAVTPCGPNAAPHSRQCECPSPHAVFLILSRRLERRLRAHANGREMQILHHTQKKKKKQKTTNHLSQ